ncbi:MAG TPA: glycosyltransferase family 2 protein [Crinalium sp.]
MIALIGAMTYSARLRRIAETAPKLAIAADPTSVVLLDDSATGATVSVIIPAYNEAENIEACVRSVLQNTTLSAEQLDVWVVDDQSSDATLTIAQTLQQTLDDPRLRVLAGKPRPKNEIWVGKNWACVQASTQSTGAFLLFLDADVRLKPGAIVAAVKTAEQTEADLLSVCPRVVCGCLTEWLVQPILVNQLLANLDFAAVAEPQTDAVFAAGPFMLFRRTAYDQIGGHKGVANQVVEDVELARRIKQSGLRLLLLLGNDVADLRMYRSFATLWEGWTKNLYLGTQRNLKALVIFALTMLTLYTAPWFGFIFVLCKAAIDTLTMVDVMTFGVALAAILLHYDIRRLGGNVSAIPTRYWWLTGVGGALVAAIAIASIIKTETGWGWTWRGRALQLPNANSDVEGKK